MAHISNWYRPGRKNVLGKEATLDIADAKPLVDEKSAPFALGFQSDTGQLMICYLTDNEVVKLLKGATAYLKQKED